MINPDKMKVLLTEMNLSAVARSAGISYGSLYGWLKLNKEPSYRVIVKLSNHLESLGLGQKDKI